jgi:crotonobetainyl-CoA:carnitine CoA-transferase CaiB-like acyl-CoA transferase
MCGQWLADLGADVIKIEPPEGDEARTWKPVNGAGAGAIFLANNAYKRSVVLDLKTVEGREAVRRLAAGADIVVESFTPGVAERLGIDHVSLRSLNPRLVCCSISGFGSSGPMREARGYDPILQAFSGMMSMCGMPDGPPMRASMAPIDQATGLNGLVCILAALMNRERTGEGTHIEVCLLDSAVHLMAWNFQMLWATGREPGKQGTRNRTRVPYEVFEAADGPFMVAVGSEPIWARFCPALGCPELVEDPRFRTNDDRMRHYDEIIDIVQAAFEKQSKAYWHARFTEAGVPNSPVHGLAEVLAHPQTRSRNIVYNLESNFGSVQTVGMPASFDGERARDRRPPPALGEHTEAVLGEFGFAPHEVAALVARGAAFVHTPPDPAMAAPQ